MRRLAPQAYSALLREISFRRFWAGGAVSSFGDAMSEVTIVWLALKLSPAHAGLAIAVATSAYLVPGVVSGIALGPLLDRFSARALILVDSLARATLLLVIAALDASGALTLPVYAALLGLAAVTRPIGAAGSRGLVRDLLPAREYFSANSLVASTVQLATVAGPAVSGVMIAWIGAGKVLAVDAATFFVLAAAVANVKTTARGSGLPSLMARRSTFRDLLRLRRIAGLFALTFFFHFLYGPLVVALPIHAQTIGSRVDLAGSTVLGVIWSGFGVGAVVGGLLAGQRRSLASPTTAVVIVGLWGAATIIVGATTAFAVATGAMAFGGLTYAPYTSITTTVMQQDAPEGAFARISSYWSSMTSIASPAGALAAGAVLAVAGARTVLVGSGAALLFVSLASGGVLLLGRERASAARSEPQP